MKTLMNKLFSVALLALGIPVMATTPAPTDVAGLAVNPSGVFKYLNVDANGALMLATSSLPGATVSAPSAVFGTAVNPSGKFQYLSVDANGGLIVSGSSILPSMSAGTANAILTNNGSAASWTLTPTGLTSINGLAFPTVGTGQYFSVGLNTTAVKTAATYAAQPGDFVPCDTTSNAITITLPTAPADKTRVAAKLVIMGGSNGVTINTGGTDVFNKVGGGTSYSMPLVNQAVSFQYAAGTPGIWYAVSNDVALSQLDARYPQLAAGTNTFTGTSLLGVNTVKSAALSDLTLGTGTFGTGITLASATGTATFAVSPVVSTFSTAGVVVNNSLGVLSSTTALPSTTTATTQSVLDNTTAVATDAFANAAGRAAFVGTIAAPDTTAGAMTLVAPLTIVYTDCTAANRTYTLPAAAAGNKGMAVMIVAAAVGAHHINFQPYSGDIFYVSGAAITVNYYFQDASPSVGDYAVAISDGVHWSFTFGTGYIGTWAAASGA